MTEKIKFELNGKPVSLDVDGDRDLLWVLRTDLEMTGVKYGCGEGLCGACTVLVDGEAMRPARSPSGGWQAPRSPASRGLKRTDGSIRFRMPSSDTMLSNADSAPPE